MASLGLASDELKQLDLMRNRFSQLSNSLASLQKTVFSTQPLPSQFVYLGPLFPPLAIHPSLTILCVKRESLQASASILLQNVNSIQEITSENAELFQRLSLHPSTNFPGRTHEHVLLTLLRKKLEPDIEGVVEEAREAARAAGVDVNKLGGGLEGDEEEEYGGEQEGEVPGDHFNEQWADVWEACFDGVKDYIENQAGEPYTLAEQEMGIKNVRTGLKRSLEDESEDEDEDEDDESIMETGTAVLPPAVAGQVPSAGVGAASKVPGIQPEHVLWFAMRGDLQLPPYVELESQRAAKESGKKPGMAR